MTKIDITNTGDESVFAYAVDNSNQTVACSVEVPPGGTRGLELSKDTHLVVTLHHVQAAESVVEEAVETVEITDAAAAAPEKKRSGNGRKIT